MIFKWIFMLRSSEETSKRSSSGGKKKGRTTIFRVSQTKKKTPYLLGTPSPQHSIINGDSPTFHWSYEKTYPTPGTVNSQVLPCKLDWHATFCQQKLCQQTKKPHRIYIRWKLLNKYINSRGNGGLIYKSSSFMDIRNGKTKDQPGASPWQLVVSDDCNLLGSPVPVVSVALVGPPWCRLRWQWSGRDDKEWKGWEELRYGYQ